MNENFYLESYGCSANKAGSEIMAGLLERQGFIQVSSPEHASVIIINTCIVKLPTEHFMARRIKELDMGFPDAKLIVAGCMPDAELDLVKKSSPRAFILGSHRIKEILRLVNPGASEREITGGSDEVKLGLPRARFNPAIAIIPISEGCLGNCAYCIVKFAKGRLRSYPLNEIVEEVRKSVESGCREIWLTSQDCSAYGRDYSEKSQLPNLLHGINAVKGKFWVRVGMMNPDNILPVIPELIHEFQSMKVFKFIHIPVQSGSNAVLRKMRRNYTVEDFKKIISLFRASIPRIAVSTDIICGFPGETEEQFNESRALSDELKFDFMNISRFWPMPGTDAFSMPDSINGNITKKRSQILKVESDRVSLEKNRLEIGAEYPVLIDADLKEGSYSARNEFYMPVSVQYAGNIGKYGNRARNIFNVFSCARITGATSHGLIGEIAEKNMN
jgi:threonylcarbamoyladenosine tRNA methylthiotransferase CDKAL1